MEDERPPPVSRRTLNSSSKRSWSKTLLFFLTANAVVLLLVLIVGELGLRWYVEGGLGPALESIVGRRTAATFLGTGDWLLHDDELGYKLNPARNGINAYGLRNPEVEPTKPPGTRRIIVLGDSISWKPDSFVAMLRDRLARGSDGSIEVISAAVPGYTTYQERLLLERDLLPLKPDLVVLQYCVNDNHRFLHHLTPDGKWLITQEAKKALFAHGDGLLARLSNASYLVLELRRRLLALEVKESSGRFPWDVDPGYAPAWHEASWPAFAEHLASMRDSLKAIGASLVVLAVPYEPQLRDDLLAADEAYTLMPQREIARIAGELGVPYLDLFTAFHAHRSERLYDDDGLHLRQPGHEVVAAELQRFLVAHRLVGARSDG